MEILLNIISHPLFLFVGGVLASPLFIKWYDVQLGILSIKKHSKWQLKYETCLEALNIIDSVLSNRSDFTGIGNLMKPNKTPLEIDKVRSVFNKLCLVCDNVNTPKFFMDKITCAKGTSLDLTDIRNAIRKELGFGKILDLDKKNSFICTLNGYKE